MPGQDLADRFGSGVWEGEVYRLGDLALGVDDDDVLSVRELPQRPPACSCHCRLNVLDRDIASETCPVPYRRYEVWRTDGAHAATRPSA